MELRQLRYFVRIVELGSLSRAAADVFIAQPALSQQVSSLEAELGVRLLARSVRGVTPTEAGEVFYRYAQAVLRLVERVRTEVRRTSEVPTGLVSVGLPTSVANVLAAPLIAAAQDRHPGIRLQITEGLSGHLEELVANGRVEMALRFDRQRTDDPIKAARKDAAHLRVRPLLTEELFLLSAGKARFGPPLPLAEAARYRFVLPGQANTTRQIVQETFQAAGHELDVIAELDSLSTIKSVVARGLGATVLSASALAGASGADGITARRFSDPPLRRLVSVCTYEILALSAAAECILLLIEEVTRALVHSGDWVGASLLDELPPDGPGGS